MLIRTELRRGWCPGALSPMLAKDGFLLRFRISGGIVGAATMRAIANASRSCGNRLIDLSARGNLQLRGVSQATLAALTERLSELGLIDEDPAAEAIRNVMVSPLAGLGAAIDVGPIGKALEAALVAAVDLHRLPGKFGFLIDDGGALSLEDEPADIRFAYRNAHDDFAISIGGVSSDAVSLGFCAPNRVVATALDLARSFLKLGDALSEPPRRMMDLISQCGSAVIAESAGLTPTPARQQGRIEAPSPIGLISFDDSFCFGAGAPFGRLTADMLDAAAQAAETYAAAEIRLTPWRALLLPHVDASANDALRRHFTAANFIVAPDDARLRLAACGGAPACERATTQTREDALALAAIARRFNGASIALHVSGCQKGCARPRPTPVTLVGRGGLYDLIINGTPYDPSAAQNLTLTAARDMLETMTHGVDENAKSKCI
ncbi:Precorrin-3B synthase [Methylocella tundrae]|uniref:Precorrin-3B synthase n=1 Tax=Methylocella tundrae TaxID=227605 RepID=A0A8B6MCG2_METTU|nr:precorrin-3B synthase [Methylocella tundrae]VTZ27640.1 Precorrin-3B synthase [Methylocella tundrae]VTZ51798.1 Precorrin-3B synthase [Methylocella tundrae]